VCGRHRIDDRASAGERQAHAFLENFFDQVFARFEMIVEAAGLGARFLGDFRELRADIAAPREHFRRGVENLLSLELAASAPLLALRLRVGAQ
jgi:hypothetical protein